MKRLFYGLTAAMAVAIACSSCSAFGGGQDYNASDLIGTWQNESNPQHYMVFTYQTSDSITEGYHYGYEWNEEEDIYEEDLVEHGNGWFEWKLQKKDLLYIELTDLYAQGIGDNRYPNPYTVKTLTSSRFSYTNGNRTLSFQKVVSPDSTHKTDPDKKENPEEPDEDNDPEE